jgi:putative ABC transport system permease protein
LGLAAGMMCFILILLYVQFENSYDNFHEKRDMIYRVYWQNPGSEYIGNDYYVATSSPLAQALMDEYSEVVNATRTRHTGRSLLIYKENRFYEEGIFADENFLRIFTFPLLRGNEEMVLSEPYSIVISEKLAKRYFGNEDPVGKIVVKS